VPQRINYQGYLTDSGGNPVNGSVDIVFSIYDVAAGGTAIWTETQTVVVNKGLFNVQLGSVTPLPSFSGTRYLGIQVGADPEMTPRLLLASAPYALNAESVGGLNSTAFVRKSGDTMSASSNNPVLVVTNTGNGVGVYGNASGSNGIGVAGSGGLVGGLFTTLGDNGVGVIGTVDVDNGAGVIGRGSGSNGRGVLGGASGSNGIGVVGNASGSNGIGVFGYAGGTGKAGYFQGNVAITGNLNVVSGTKNFVQPDPRDPSKEIVYSCLEGGESGVYVRGTGQLQNGTAEVQLPEDFGLVTAEEGVTVQITPLDDCLGIYVVQKSPEMILVREAQGGTGNARFDYLVMGVRKGFENFQVIRENKDLEPVLTMNP
jgi:hypothetical protein